MSGLPAPTGRPVAYSLRADPWAEQARRHEQHRQRRRERRRKGLMFVAVPVAVLGVAAASGWWFVLREPPTEQTSGAAVATPRSTEPAQPAGPEQAGPEQASAEQAGPEQASAEQDGRAGGEADAAVVKEVWLLDRKDGTYDWGLIIESESAVSRTGLAVTATFFDDRGQAVHAESATLELLAAGARAAVGGTARPPTGPGGESTAAPVRIEVSATLGEPADWLDAAQDDEPGDAQDADQGGLLHTLHVEGVDRVRSGQLDIDDVLVGQVAGVSDHVLDSAAGLRPDLLGVAALWRDDDNAVVAAVFGSVVGELDSSVFGFELPLAPGAVPRGMPDDVIVSWLSSQG